jgi:HK97 family phage major capsid protein
MDHHFLRGSGAGQPLGALSDPAIISVPKESGQTADTIQYENLAKMFARHYAPQRAVWVTNSSTLPSLLTLSIAVGTAGSHVKVLNESNGKFSILGRPVLFSPSMPVLGDVNDIIFADFSQYAIGLRRNLRLEKSNIPGWTQDLMSYRVLVRFDGMGTWNEAITPRNGNSLSWIVGLAERA